VSEPQSEFLEIFRDEANERLDKIVACLLELEKGEGGADAIDALLRETHTLKGAAGMVGLDEARTLAHSMEDLLSVARETGEFPPDLTDPLLRAADAMRGYVAGNGAPTEDVVEELASHKQLSADAPDAAVVESNPADTANAAVVESGPATAPSTGDKRSIRVPSAKIDALLDLVGEAVLHRGRLEHAVGQQLPVGQNEVSDELVQGGRLVDALKDTAIGMRTLPLESITGSLPRAVRDLAVAEGKEVELTVTGAETELDRVILEGLSDPLVHIFRNSVAHGIETPDERERAGKPRAGRLELRAEQRGRLVEITVADDGRGVSQKTLDQAGGQDSLAEILAQPGFSTADSVSELAGRGVGLDAVKSHVESFGGTLEVRSQPGKGTAIVLHLPLALALLEVLLVERAGNVYGVPLASVEEAIAVTETLSLSGKPALELRGASLPLTDLAELVGAETTPMRERAPAIVISAGGRRIAAACDTLLGKEEIVVKSLGTLLASVKGYLGAAILRDGRVALLLEPGELVRRSQGGRQGTASPVARIEADEAKRKVLVVEDSFTVRELQRSILEAAGYPVDTARNGKEALKCLTADEGIGLVLSDVDMPEMDGIELTRSIRAMVEYSSLPVVIVTSRSEEQDRQRGIDAGADAYMVKTAFDQRELLGTIERLIGT
jgi:two-component system chemotaxis sensor kinase CheA